MRIEGQGQSLDLVTSFKQTNIDTEKQPPETTGKQKSQEDSVPNTEMLQQAVDSLNEVFEINKKELKFVYHDGLEQYYVQLVDSKTEEVVKEIPSKKLLDAFYEMQKLVGMIIDEKR